MSNVGKVNFKGRVKEYTFDVFYLDSPLREIPAVYIVTRAEPNRSGGYTQYPIYIGQTDNLKTRMAETEKESCFSANHANRLCVIALKDEKSRKAIEADLLAQWTTPCNE